MSAQLDIETASPTSPRSPTSLIGHAADENSEDTNRGLISGHLRTGLGFTKKALGLGITLLLVGAVVLLALNYSATTEISEGNVLSSNKDHKPLKTASLHYIVNRLDKYTESHDLKELFGTLEDVTVTSPSGRMDKVKATESHLSADGKKLTLTGATGSKAVIEKLSNGKVVVAIVDPNAKAAKTTKPGARRSGSWTQDFSNVLKHDAGITDDARDDMDANINDLCNKISTHINKHPGDTASNFLSSKLTPESEFFKYLDAAGTKAKNDENVRQFNVAQVSTCLHAVARSIPSGDDKYMGAVFWIISDKAFRRSSSRATKTKANGRTKQRPIAPWHLDAAIKYSDLDDLINGGTSTGGVPQLCYKSGGWTTDCK